MFDFGAVAAIMEFFFHGVLSNHGNLAHDQNM